ncbi:MAG: hypothetical protein Q9161_003225 [Pseudevernia consocians]
MSSSETSTRPLGNLLDKKRKYDQLDRPPPPLPPNGSVLYIALHALDPSEHRGGVLNYRWAFLLAPDDKPGTPGRQYLIRQTGPKAEARAGTGSSRGHRTLGREMEELGLEQQRRRLDRLLATNQSGDPDDPQKPCTWEFEIQNVCMQSSKEARVRLKLPRVQDVELFEALIRDAFLGSHGTRGVEWNHVMWLGDAWTALVENGKLFGLGRQNSDLVRWEVVQKTALEFVKAQESEARFEERNLTLRVPTWGLLERQLLVS